MKRNIASEKGLNEINFSDDLEVNRDVPRQRYEKDLSGARTSGFWKGVVSTLLLLLVAGGATYCASGFGEQLRYEFLEPDYDLPELKEDIIKEEGSLEEGQTDVETIEE